MEPIFTTKGLVGWLENDVIWDTRMTARAFVRDDGIFSFRGSGYRGFIHEGVLRNTSSLTVAFLGEARPSWDHSTHAAVSPYTSNAADSSDPAAHAADTADTTHPFRFPLCGRLGLISRVSEGQDPALSF